MHYYLNYLLLKTFALIDVFRHLCSRRLLKTLWQKKIEIAQNKQFHLLQQCFQLFAVIIPSFTEIFCDLVKMFLKQSPANCPCRWNRPIHETLFKTLRGWFSHEQTLMRSNMSLSTTHLQQKTGKHCGKSRNFSKYCSWFRISPFRWFFPTPSLTILSFIKIFYIFVLSCLLQTCCKLYAGKGLNPDNLRLKVIV